VLRLFLVVLSRRGDLNRSGRNFRRRRCRLRLSPRRLWASTVLRPGLVRLSAAPGDVVPRGEGDRVRALAAAQGSRGAEQRAAAGLGGENQPDPAPRATRRQRPERSSVRLRPGASVDPPRLESGMRTGAQATRSHSTRKRLRVVDIRDDDAEQPPVLSSKTWPDERLARGSARRSVAARPLCGPNLAQTLGNLLMERSRPDPPRVSDLPAHRTLRTSRHQTTPKPCGCLGDKSSAVQIRTPDCTKFLQNAGASHPPGPLFTLRIEHFAG
jgi:hypothetical protein